MAPAAIVLLPAALTTPDHFIMHGFAEAIDASGLDVDLLIPDLHADCYLRSTAVAMLDDMLRTHVRIVTRRSGWPVFHWAATV